MSGAIDRGAGMINVESIQRRGKAIGVALTADFAISDDVYARLLHFANCEPRGIVLRLFEEWFRHAPDLARPHTRRQPAAQLLAIHQPVRLRIAADDGCRNEFGHGHLGTLFPASIVSNRLAFHDANRRFARLSLTGWTTTPTSPCQRRWGPLSRSCCRIHSRPHSSVCLSPSRTGHADPRPIYCS